MNWPNDDIPRRSSWFNKFSILAAYLDFEHISSHSDVLYWVCSRIHHVPPTWQLLWTFFRIIYISFIGSTLVLTRLNSSIRSGLMRDLNVARDSASTLFAFISDTCSIKPDLERRYLGCYLAVSLVLSLHLLLTQALFLSPCTLSGLLFLHANNLRRPCSLISNNTASHSLVIDQNPVALETSHSATSMSALQRSSP
jgi:hypothetical protein